MAAIPFNIMSGFYEAFIGHLRNALAGPNPDEVEGHPVLANQTGVAKPPPRWIYVQLEGKSGVNPTLAIRSDNAYIVGFTNKDGRWFEFNNTAMLLPRGNTKMLSYDDAYDDNLRKLKLGKFNTSDAATVLWNVNDNNLGSDLKKAVTTLAVTFCEAARIIPVFEVINRSWENQTGSSVSITDQHNKYIHKWGKISAALLGWKKDKNDDKWFKYLKEEESTGIIMDKKP